MFCMNAHASIILSLDHPLQVWYVLGFYTWFELLFLTYHLHGTGCHGIGEKAGLPVVTFKDNVHSPAPQLFCLVVFSLSLSLYRSIYRSVSLSLPLSIYRSFSLSLCCILRLKPCVSTGKVTTSLDIFKIKNCANNINMDGNGRTEKGTLLCFKCSRPLWICLNWSLNAISHQKAGLCHGVFRWALLFLVPCFIPCFPYTVTSKLFSHLLLGQNHSVYGRQAGQHLSQECLCSFTNGLWNILKPRTVYSRGAHTFFLACELL